MTKLLERYSFLPAFLRSPPDDGGSNAGGGDSGGAGAGGSTALTGGSPAPAAEPGSSGHAGNLYGDDDPAPEDKTGDDPSEKPKDETKAKDEDAPAWVEYVDDPDKTDEENAAAKLEHDKTKPAEDDKDKTKEEPAINAADYEFVEIPEGFELDPAVDKEFRDFAAERKWSKDDVKALSAMQVKLYAKQSEVHAEQVATWGEELKTDKEVGGRGYDANMSKAREAKIAFFPPEVNAILDKTGLGNHPAIVKGFVRIGKAMGEMTTLHGKGKPANTSILENLYGSDT